MALQVFLALSCSLHAFLPPVAMASRGPTKATVLKAAQRAKEHAEALEAARKAADETDKDARMAEALISKLEEGIWGTAEGVHLDFLECSSLKLHLEAYILHERNWPKLKKQMDLWNAQITANNHKKNGRAYHKEVERRRPQAKGRSGACLLLSMWLR